MTYKQQKAFTIRSDNGLLRSLKSGVGVCAPFVGLSVGKEEIKCKGFNAIWDTGATGSVITEKVADALGLKPTGFKEVHTANGKSEKNTYLVNIILPNNVAIQNVNVTEGLLGDHADVLIGMDIITLGDFSITNKDGNTVMSFRIPSLQEIDYVPIANQANKLEQFKQKRQPKNTATKKKKTKRKKKLK